MTYRMWVIGSLTQPRLNAWLKAYQPHGHGGRGHATFTRNRADAKQYASPTEAWGDWKTVSRTHPTRADGKPNRPLSAFTIEVLPDDQEPIR